MLTGLRLAEPPAPERDAFPFAIPALRGLGPMSIPGPVTFFAGENGSGKSTLLEAIAIAANLPTVGSKETGADDSLASQRKLARRLTAVWDRKMHRGFFLRAEDLLGFIGRLGGIVAEMEARLSEIEREYRGRSDLARRLAMGPVAATLAARGQNPPGIRTAMRPRWPLRFTHPRCKVYITLCNVCYTICYSKAALCVAPRANSAAIPPSSRLASAAPRRSRCSGGFVHGLLGSICARYGGNLDANSHGETFLHVFRERFVPRGLYLIDEPEAALSPQSQLGFVSMMADVVNEGGQLIIATHSPVLMAVPGATIYNFDESPLREAAYEALDGVRLMKDFLQAPERYMRDLWRKPGAEPRDR